MRPLDLENIPLPRVVTPQLGKVRLGFPWLRFALNLIALAPSKA